MSEREFAETEIVTVPDESAVPDEGAPDTQQFGRINNLAGDEELANQFKAWASRNKTRFEGQGPRDEFTKQTGTMDTADRMYRVALNRDTGSDQHQDTLSDVTSTVYHRTVNTINAALNGIFFDDDNLPAHYEPEVNSSDYTIDQGKDIADQQNLLEQYTWDEDKREDKVRNGTLTTCKYGHSMFSIEWLHVEREKIIKEPTGFDDNGNPIRFRHKKKKVVVADYPTLIEHDMRNCWFDSQIEDVDKWRCFLRQGMRTYEDLIGDQEAGFIKNVEKISPVHLFKEEEQPQVLKQRQENAGEDTVSEESGLYSEWHVWGWVPIKEYKGNRKGRGKWDPQKTVPSLYWATFVGDIGGNAVCTRLIKNPYFHGRIPYFIWHSHRDDKGPYHMGYASILKSLYWQDCTNINQAFDNVTAINKAPMVADGRVHNRDLTFRQNNLIRTDRGVRFERLNIPQTTAVTFDMSERIERDMENTTGANAALQGVSQFARTSAFETRQNLDQALAPIDEKANYMGNFFVWMFEIDQSLWRQYGTWQVLKIATGKNEISKMIPANLWGALRTKVTAVSRFRNTIQRRQEMAQYLQNVWPNFKDIAGPTGNREMGIQSALLFGVKNVDSVFPSIGDGDAEDRSKHENYLVFVAGMPIEIKPTDNHTVHVHNHDAALKRAKQLPPDDELAVEIREMEAHKLKHEQALEQASTVGRQTENFNELRSPTQEAGEALEAQGGAEALG